MIKFLLFICWNVNCYESQVVESLYTDQREKVGYLLFEMYFVNCVQLIAFN